MNKVTMTLKFKKSTKGTHVYSDDSDNAVVSSIYIRKHIFNNRIPDEIILTVEEKKS